MPDVETVAETTTGDGGTVKLVRDGRRWFVRLDGKVLMSSETHGSEETLAELACGPLAGRERASVLVGGLGMGFTLRAVLDLLAADARVTVAELLPAVVEWNRGALAPLAGSPLDDPRVSIEIRDVAALLDGAARYDAILLDVDNGPEAFTVASNDDLYDARGLARLRSALRPGGKLGVWSAFRDRGFERRLAQAGFDARGVPVRARGRVRKGAAHQIFVGTAP